MRKRRDGFRLSLVDGRVDIDLNLAENAIRIPAVNRRNALFAGHDEGGRNRARFASLTGTCKTRVVKPCVCLRDLCTILANRPLAKRHRSPDAAGLRHKARHLRMTSSRTPRRAHPPKPGLEHVVAIPIQDPHEA